MSATYHHIVPMSRNLGALNLLDPSGPAWPVMGVLLFMSANNVVSRCREMNECNAFPISRELNDKVPSDLLFVLLSNDLYFLT
jgi:hypothetical protein